MPSHRPSSRPSRRPSYRPDMHRSIPPSEPRKRAVVAGISLTLLGAVLVMAVVRSCAGEDFWEDAQKVHEE